MRGSARSRYSRQTKVTHSVVNQQIRRLRGAIKVINHHAMHALYKTLSKTHTARLLHYNLLTRKRVVNLIERS